VSDLAGGTWQPTVEQLTRDPRRYLELARDALYSGAGLEPSTREADWEAAVKHMKRCEDAIRAGGHRWNRYLDETQSGAERAAVTLGVVRDLSFAVVTTIATGGAATVAEGAAIGAGVSVLGEAASQEGESLAGLRDRPDMGRFAAAGAGGAVSGGMGAAVRPMGGPLATRIGRGMVAGGLTAATDETTRQTVETAFGERTETDLTRIGAAGLGGVATGGLVEAASGVGRRGPAESSGVPEVARPNTATEPASAAGGTTRSEAAVPEAAPRALGEREAMLPPEPGPRLPGERTAVPPQEPEGYMAPLPAEPPASVPRWPGYEPGIRDDGDIRPLTDAEVETALRFIEAHADVRYRVQPPGVYENLYRRGGDAGSLPPGFVDRRGVVVLPESALQGGSAGAGGPGRSAGAPEASGPATIPDRPSRSSTIPASPSRAPTVPGGRSTVPDATSPTIPVDPSRAPTLPGGPARAAGAPEVAGSPTIPDRPSRASTIPIEPRPDAAFRALAADEASAIAADLESGASRPNTLASRADTFDESFRAIYGREAPLPEYGYVDDAGRTYIRLELVER